MRIPGRQNLVRINPNTQVSNLFLDMTKTVWHAGGNNDYVSRWNRLSLAIVDRAPATGADPFSDRCDISRKLSGIGLNAASDKNALSRKYVVHLSNTVMNNWVHFLSFGACFQAP